MRGWTLLFGTHGTCQSRANLIVTNQNFDAPTVRAYAGPGAYFWEHGSSPDVAKELAELWWLYSHSKGCYEAEADQALSIIGVEIKAPAAQEFLDATSHDFNEKLYKLLKKFEGSVENIDVHEVMAMAIGDLAEERGVPILLVKTLVKPPPTVKGRQPSMVYKAYQAWPCLVVREGGDGLFSKIFTIQ